jgi:hypothetical protein
MQNIIPSVVGVHYTVALLLFVLAIAAIFYAPARRVCAYVLVLQVVVGVAILVTLRPMLPVAHVVLGLATGAVWPMANAFARRGRPARLVMGVCALGAVLVAIVISLGMHAAGK